MRLQHEFLDFCRNVGEDSNKQVPTFRNIYFPLNQRHDGEKQTHQLAKDGSVRNNLFTYHPYHMKNIKRFKPPSLYVLHNN